VRACVRDVRACVRCTRRLTCPHARTHARTHRLTCPLLPSFNGARKTLAALFHCICVFFVFCADLDLPRVNPASQAGPRALENAFW
jgi:hypothetical protein